MGHPEEVDVIVCGGGPAGCVVAGRLAYADPTLKVMLIEGGANNRDDPWVYRPGIYVRNMQRNGINDKATFYTDTMASSYLRGRRSIVPCANILGGGSSINFQMYTRASASDWDDFKTEGWTCKDLLPLMKRLENYQKPCNNDTHGYDGPIAISNGGQIMPVAQDFLRAAHAIGVPYSDDIQDLTTAHGAEIWAKYINRHTGRRSDAATAYVHSVMDVQDNLFLRCNARVSRVLFDDNNKAVGVAYVPSRNRTHGGKLHETIVKARKMVVLSSGTLGTPQILERSGVGNGELLRQLGIKIVSDLPGVGEQYQDHYTTLSIYRVSNESITTDDFLRGVKDVQRELFTEWEVSPEKARLSSNAIDAGFKIRPTEEELKEMGPEFNELWNRYFKDKPDKPVMFGSIVAGAYADHTLLPPGKYITMFQYLEYPASRGKIHIKSQNPYVEPFFDSGFMNNKADFAPIRWSYKKTREVARRMDAFRGELTSHHPRFHPASPAACKDIDIETAKQIYPDGLTVGIHMGSWHQPSEPYKHDKVIEDIPYTEEDDKAIDDWVADHVETTWHSLGTCAMKPREQGGVVDKRLNVYGTQNLKCVDLSICPDNLGTNTYSSALLVGEKGADLIAEELGLKIKTPHAPVPHAPVPTGRPATQQVR
nr:Chain A, Alcohol oxidase [Phanerodontia chrysosporium]6H3G_B Chain B, Alcohol oxidase [Phanerodontia chrysosporium]6H3G_C Chain C, Alcohol oxidase [Phanerodontia chrysosporium]6H3G_D Chain D, Alcohol oxidase [Phanerodontia chrysosporium]6H3G_E Chain E, Alcohol oxidase [Phanerodontia chrysosporium]6H3G_F Chain F, Alcohol oxidase [Phanerodontia chrysosporium]6H3G_G Chain G, Alcohol oxidase [Phanerodontia chrysosporium]6H3G_H Chain H, Alcohol oxidase [Phanerodontia chrysosporium]CDG66232.1 